KRALLHLIYGFRRISNSHIDTEADISADAVIISSYIHGEVERIEKSIIYGSEILGGSSIGEGNLICVPKGVVRVKDDSVLGQVFVRLGNVASEYMVRAVIFYTHVTDDVKASMAKATMFKRPLMEWLNEHKLLDEQGRLKTDRGYLILKDGKLACVKEPFVITDKTDFFSLPVWPVTAKDSFDMPLVEWMNIPDAPAPDCYKVSFKVSLDVMGYLQKNNQVHSSVAKHFLQLSEKIKGDRSFEQNRQVRNVLIVEDAQSTAERLHETAKRVFPSANIAVAYSGVLAKVAIDHCEEGFDLLILDWELPKTGIGPIEVNRFVTDVNKAARTLVFSQEVEKISDSDLERLCGVTIVQQKQGVANDFNKMAQMLLEASRPDVVPLAEGDDALDAWKSSQCFAPFFLATQDFSSLFGNAELSNTSTALFILWIATIVFFSAFIYFKYIKQKSSIQMPIRAEAMQMVFNAIFENFKDVAVVLKDRNSRFIYCNKAFCDTLRGIIPDISPENIRGRTDEEVYPVNLAKLYREDDRRVMDTGNNLLKTEHNFSKGKIISVQVVKVPVKNKEGNVSGILCMFWDVTAEHESNKQREFAAIGETWANLAHVLAGPVTGVINYIEFALDAQPLPERANTNLNSAREIGMELKKIIDTTLNMVKGPQSVKKKTVNAQQLLETALLVSKARI
ncbi:MAG: PAS domain-containing protein, partial [Candidatus Omnitrophica bacterium]|nr:PAS domain-containing protein [Candidatus Omnitrophota bacterium]